MHWSLSLLWSQAVTFVVVSGVCVSLRRGTCQCMLSELALIRDFMVVFFFLANKTIQDIESKAWMWMAEDEGRS